MAGGTGRANSSISYPAEICTMTEGAHSGELGWIYVPMSINVVIPMGIIPGTNRRMGSKVIMACLTASAAKNDRKVKTRINPFLGMAWLTVQQSAGKGRSQSLCSRTMILGI